MRLFIAIPIDSKIKDYLRDIPMAGKVVVDYHITLKFLGELPDYSFLLDQLKDVRTAPFKLVLDKIGSFHSSHQQVVWVGVAPVKPVVDLHDEIEKVLDVKKDKRFHPHITLSRLKGQKMNRLIIEKKEMNVNSFQLIKSTLTSKGPKYTVIKTYLLS